MKTEITGQPIDNATMLLGKEIFNVKSFKVDNHKDNDSGLFGATIGNMLKYAAVESVVVRGVEINEQDTGVIINPKKEKITIPFEQGHLDIMAESTFFDNHEKAEAVANQLNSANLEKAEKIENEARQAKDFIKSLLKLKAGK